mgnify:CR=1 FL=1
MYGMIPTLDIILTWTCANFQPSPVVLWSAWMLFSYGVCEFVAPEKRPGSNTIVLSY